MLVLSMINLCLKSDLSFLPNFLFSIHMLKKSESNFT